MNCELTKKMMLKTANEEEVVKRLFKDIDIDYNPSIMAKRIGLTREGVFKILRYLEEKGIVKSKAMGKANYYSINLDDPYVRKLVEVLLMEEARVKKRWLFELTSLFEHSQVVVMFGSMIANEKKASDIDILIVMVQEKNKNLNREIKFKNEVLPKSIHPVKQTEDDLVKNIRKRDKVVLGALKHGIVLHGYEKYVELIKDARSR